MKFAFATVLSLLSSVALGNRQLESLQNEVKTSAVVNLVTNAGFSVSPFGGTGSQASNTFTVNTGEIVSLQVTDYQCAGDVFSVYDGNTLLFTSSAVAGPDCSPWTPDPNVAWADARFSKGSITLKPGNYNIRIVLASAPYGGGMVAIRVSSICFPKNNPGLMAVLSDAAHPYGFKCAEASNACSAWGLKKADLDIYNFLSTTSGAFECGGSMSRHYVRSWFGDTYGDGCVALHLGSAPPGGSINLVDGQTDLPVLCQTA
jgi:hypothetical protein